MAMMGRRGAAVPGWGPGGGGAGCGMPSASVKSWPSAILAPTKRKKFVVTTAERTCSGVPSSLGRTLRKVKTPARSWNAPFVPSRKSMKSSLEKGKSRTLRLRMSLATMTSRSGSLYGRGRNSTALVTLKMAVLAPTPRAMVSAAVSAKIGLFRSVRPANARSRNGILPPHSKALAALRILPPLSAIGFEFLGKRLLSGMWEWLRAQTGSRAGKDTWLAGGGCVGGGFGGFAVIADHADEGLGGAGEAAVATVDEAEFAPEVDAFDSEELDFAGLHVVFRKILTDDGEAGI